jgi:hypothetical protein
MTFLLKFLGTKFLLSLLSLCGGFWLAATGNPLLGGFTSLVGIVLGSYVVGNVGQDVIEATKQIKGVKGNGNDANNAG